ncbi:phage tail protein [Snodgrassella alvi]|uniref:phage tail protein n=1 Tax=Snodgrassella alvi TaxID=1196083 RepID=UPI0034E850AC
MSKNPTLIPQAFANNGSKNTIQNTRQPGQDMEDATWSDGFPNVTMQPVESGGLPPKGMDFNGIFNTLSESIVYIQKGGVFYFDKDYANAFGGYQTGAVLMADDNTRLFVSTMDKNSNDPNQKMTGWEILAGVGINAATASRLLNGRKIGGVLFDGSQDIDLPGVNKAGTQDTSGNAATATWAAQIAAHTIGGVMFNGKGDIDLPGVNKAGNQDTSGNAATATKLKTARLIDGVSFDGTKDINTTPSGAIMYFSQSAAPSGWLKANGAALSRTTYANLFAAIGTLYGSGDGKTTFNLPDLRGEFIRSWDDGRNVDGGRGLGSWQDSQNLSHIHDGTTWEAGAHDHAGWTQDSGDHNHGVPISTNGSGSNFESNGGSVERWGNTNNSGMHNHHFVTDINGNHTHTFRTNATGGNESRPRNIALLACIKI